MNVEQLREMRTPLSAIKGFISTLLVDDEFSTEEKREFYQIIDHEVDALTHILNRLIRAPRDENDSLDVCDEKEIVLQKKLVADLESAARQHLADAQLALENAAGLTA